MQATKTTDVWKFKKWWPILGPKYLGGKQVGETPAAELRETIGRTINISLAAVTDDIRQQHINATFKITGVDGNNALTELIKYETMPAYIRRHMRKGRTRIDDSFVCKTTENADVIIKPFIITRTKIVGSQETTIRKLAKATLKELVSKMNYEQLVQELVTQRIQKRLSEVLRKISPLKSCEIRVMELLKKEGIIERAEKPKTEERIKEEPTKVEKKEAEKETKEEKEIKKEEAKTVKKEKNKKKTEEKTEK